jgi:hypothetical protein
MRFWRKDKLERELATAFRPSEQFESELQARVSASAPQRPYARASRIAFASAVAVFMLGTFASFGGVSLAAEGAKGTFHAVKRVTVAQAPLVRHKTSASDEYGKQKPAKATPKAPKQQFTPPTTVVAGVNTTPRQSTLPVTGISLLMTLAVSLALAGSGFALRRLGAARERSR